MDEARVSVSNGTLSTCIYPGDKPFKKGSNTYPRSELRSLEERNGTIPYLFEVEVLQLPNGTDYGIWQVFGGGSPLLMIRHRLGEHQMVVFDGSPKITRMSEFPKSCVVDCKGGIVTCGSFSSKGSLKCEDMYFKVGIYSQAAKVEEKRCVVYGRTKYFALI